VLLRCRTVAGELHLLLLLIVLLARVTMSGWLNTALPSRKFDAQRPARYVPGRLATALLRTREPWALVLYVLCLLAADTSSPSR
jgi:hypothetical protein